MRDPSLGNRIWERTRASEDAAALAARTGLSPVLASVLVTRGIVTPEAARSFLQPDLAVDWLDPDRVAGMAEAADRVVAAVNGRERIVVFGDFDLDGISAAAVAELGLKSLGADVISTVPHRFREGYGLSPASVQRLLAMQPALIVTVDCGISSAPEVAALRAAGVDVVVTDHHEPGELVPDSVPVADPKLAPYPFEPAGAGVALKLVQAVGARLGRPDDWRELLDLAALGTIADVVPLLGENRALVAEGLDAMRRSTRPGIAALASVAGIECRELTSEKAAFGLVPRLNAAGRVAEPHQALQLLLTDDPATAEDLACALDQYNQVRQAAEQDLFDSACAVAEKVFAAGDRVLVLSGKGWHEGVKGIVAARLASMRSVPAFLFAVEDGLAKGSARTFGDIDLYELAQCGRDLFVRYGGHKAAVGVTLRAEDLPEFERRLKTEAARLPQELFSARSVFEAEVPLSALSSELVAELALLEPHGCSNPKPEFVSRTLFMNDRRRVGKTGAHLKFTAFDGEASVSAIAFRCPKIDEVEARDGAVDLLYQLEEDPWKGQPRIQLKVRDLAFPAVPQGPAAALVDELFAHAEEVLARGEYEGVADAESFNTKLAGVTFEGRQQAVAGLVEGVRLRIERQPDNEHDAHACALFDPLGEQVGFFNRRLAAALAPAIDKGVEFDVVVTAVTGGQAEEGGERSLGVNVLVSRRGTSGEDGEAEEGRSRREELAAMPAEARDAQLVRHLIGDRVPHAAQLEALAHLAEGRSTLAVMATGRGKSFVFHLHAARTAIAMGAVSVFVYPLRALVADQAMHLSETLGAIGVACRTVTGETSPAGRDEAFAALADGSLDVVLTTPEFLVHHAGRFAESGRVGFVAVDEAHHVLSKAGRRPAYGKLGEALEVLGGPLVLAATATAGDEAAEACRRVLSVKEVVADATVRENLDVVDARGDSDKDGYVARLVVRGGKTVVYVNSRETSVRVARALRQKSPELMHAVAFYNGGLTRDVRHAVERAFRAGDIRVVVATSAFGEGVNIPDVREVVLYHLPFDRVEFNQMCGRSGRDGKPAGIHALYGPKDARLNELILESVAVERDDLAALYLVLKGAQTAAGDEAFESSNSELAEKVRAKRKGSRMSDKGVSTALGVFRELGLVESEGAGAYRRLRLQDHPGEKLDLASSVRYVEGQEEVEAFSAFKSWALEAPASELLASINRPILPARSVGPEALPA